MAIARLDLENLHLDLAHSRLTDASMKVVGLGWKDAGNLGRKTPLG